MSSIPLSVINLRVNKEIAIAANQIYINKNPDFQREYEAWDEILKTRFIETILIGRAMNPIWTILNPDNNSEEILDGMHRITTAIDYLNNKFKLNSKYFTDVKTREIYDKKCFSELSIDDQCKIRNYNFTFNHLDSSYRTDVTKLRDMYEILNRSSKTLNDYEFNKVLYGSFFDIISKHKNELNLLSFFIKNDKRGDLETEIIDIIVLSNELPNSWTSIINMREKYYEDTLGNTQQSVDNYLQNNYEKINDRLIMMKKIINTLKDNNFFNSDKKKFKKYYLPYKFIISRLLFKFNDISLFNRLIIDIIKKLKTDITNISDNDIQNELFLKNRNSTFQKNLIQQIDLIINSLYEKNNDKRLFSKIDIANKLKEQNNVCCHCNTSKQNYEGDHIIPWSKNGKTIYENLQVLCKDCHYKKSAL